ncbi:MAG: aspartyl protease family protein [Chloroflexota bacterium]
MKKALYSDEYWPAAPTLPVGIAAVGETPIGTHGALVDTGADGSFVPTAILEEMNLPVTYTTNARSHLGDVSYPVSIYTVDIVLFDDIRLPGLEVVGDDWGSQIILGRNVLNLLQLHLDGPGKTISLSE